MHKVDKILSDNSILSSLRFSLTNFIMRGRIEKEIDDVLNSKMFTEASLSSQQLEVPDLMEETSLPSPEEFLKIENKEEAPLITTVLEDRKVEKKKQKKKLDEEKWVLTYIPGFDKLLKKGIPAGSNIIVAGGPGTGKTIFCLQALYNAAARGKDCVYLSMEERPERLKEHMVSFGFKVKEISRTEYEIILRANNRGRVSLKRLQPIQLARSIEALLEEASGTLPIKIDMVLDFIPKGFKPYLLALDSISAVETAFSGTKRQYRIYIEQLFRYFERLNLTTFLITESSEAPKKFSNTGVEEFLADGIIVFYNFPGRTERQRGVEIYKLRGTSHAQRIASMRITDKGMVVFPDRPPLSMPR